MLRCTPIIRPPGGLEKPYAFNGRFEHVYWHLGHYRRFVSFVYDFYLRSWLLYRHIAFNSQFDACLIKGSASGNKAQCRVLVRAPATVTRPYPRALNISPEISTMFLQIHRPSAYGNDRRNGIRFTVRGPDQGRLPYAVDRFAYRNRILLLCSGNLVHQRRRVFRGS